MANCMIRNLKDNPSEDNKKLIKFYEASDGKDLIAYWSQREVDTLFRLIEIHGKNYEEISKNFENKSPNMIQNKINILFKRLKKDKKKH